MPGALSPTSIPAFFTAVLPAGTPVGNYVVFMVLTASAAFADGRLDESDSIAVATASFAIAP